MTRAVSLSASTALCVGLYALTVFGWTGAIPGDKSRTNALSMNGLHLNGLHLNGADLRAITGDAGLLRAPAGRLLSAAQ